MATLIEGEFVDDGTLPKRVVLSTARGGLVATVAQGHCALALWRGLKCIQHMRKARVKTTVCRGGLVRQNEAKAAPRALECQVLDPGAGFINGEATCKGTDGKVMHGHVVVSVNGQVDSLAPFARGPAVVGAWAVGDEFSISQAGASSAASGKVVDVVVGSTGRRHKHVHLEGDVIGVSDVDPAWMAAANRRSHHVVRSRVLQCTCTTSCTFRVTELYSFAGMCVCVRVCACVCLCVCVCVCVLGWCVCA
jgi:hypothetical protein